MQDKWYADNRDIVKWSVLLILARQYQMDRILQIAYYNPSDFGIVEVDGQSHEIPKDVLAHFRSIKNIAVAFQRPRISVFDLPLGERDSYTRAATDFIRSFSGERCLVFLDPDTGLEPRGKSGTQHILNKEAKVFWSRLPSGWVFVLYQHQTNKAGKPWVNEKRAQLARAIGVRESEVRISSGNGIARDVVLFHLRKP